MVNAFLISSITVVGTLVTILFLIWLTMLLNNRPPAPSNFIVDPSFGDQKPEGVADDVHEPGVEEFPEVETPQLADALEALTEAVSSVKANREARDGDAAEMGKGGGFGSRDGGPGNGNFRGVPEHKRWKIEYDTPDITNYANQLSFFNIDIGLITNGTNEVLRLRQPGPGGQIITSSRKEENDSRSLYFIHEKIQLRRWDERLFNQARSVDMNNRFTVQFYPSATRQLLRNAEGQFLQNAGKNLEDVRRTRFKVVETGNGYEFQIKSVDYQ